MAAEYIQIEVKDNVTTSHYWVDNQEHYLTFSYFGHMTNILYKNM